MANQNYQQTEMDLRTMNDLYEAERKDDTPTPLEQAAAENDGFEEAEPADVEADDEE